MGVFFCLHNGERPPTGVCMSHVSCRVCRTAGSYQRIGEATELALRVFTEKVGLLMLNPPPPLHLHLLNRAGNRRHQTSRLTNTMHRLHLRRQRCAPSAICIPREHINHSRVSQLRNPTPARLSYLSSHIPVSS